MSGLNKHRLLVGAVLVLWVLSSGKICLCEEAQASAHWNVVGSVVDASGAPLGNASVAIKSLAKDVVKRTNADGKGTFVLSGLEPGTYSISVEKLGFTPLTETVIVPSEELKISLARLDSSSTHTSDKDLQFSDTPSFTVAGVKDWTAAGGHGSDANIKTSETLAKQTRDLAKSGVQQPALNSANREELLQEREQLLKQLVKADRGGLHRRLGDIDEQLNDALSAEHEYERAVQLDASEENYFAWGAELLLHHAVQPANEVFSKGAAAFPRSERMMAGLGAALYASGLYEQAAERLCAASDLQPSDTAPYLFLGKMLQASPRTFPCAEKKLSRFLHDQPENAMANYYCALAIWKSSESADKRSAGAQVEPLLRKSLRIDPNFAEAYLQLGLVYSAEGQAKKAIDALEKAIGANPNLPEAHLRLGQECKKFGDSIRANAEFQKYAELTKTEAAELERQRRAIQQFVVVFQDQSARP